MISIYALNVLDAWEDLQDAHFMARFGEGLAELGDAVAYRGSKQSALQRLAMALKEMDDEAKARGAYEDPPIPPWLLSSINSSMNKKR